MDKINNKPTRIPIGKKLPLLFLFSLFVTLRELLFLQIVQTCFRCDREAWRYRQTKVCHSKQTCTYNEKTFKIYEYGNFKANKYDQLTSRIWCYDMAAGKNSVLRLLHACGPITIVVHQQSRCRISMQGGRPHNRRSRKLTRTFSSENGHNEVPRGRVEILLDLLKLIERIDERTASSLAFAHVDRTRKSKK